MTPLTTRTKPKNAGPTIVDVHFRAALTRKELVSAFRPEAPELAKTRGLRWKIWSFNSQTREFAGLYLFDDPAAARAYVDGPVVRGLAQDANLSEVHVRTYEALRELGRHTRAPMGA